MNESEFIKLKSLFIQVFNNEPGYKILNFIMNDLCGYQDSSVVRNAATNHLEVEALVYNEGRRSVYLDLRKLLSSDILKKVEIDLPIHAQTKKKVEHKKEKKHPFLERDNAHSQEQ